MTDGMVWKVVSVDLRGSIIVIVAVQSLFAPRVSSRNIKKVGLCVRYSE